MKKYDFFVTGTDTGVGKTLVTGILARFFSENGMSVITQKWVETGLEQGESDISRHIHISGLDKKDYDIFKKEVSPYSFMATCSPHLASGKENAEICREMILESFSCLSESYDAVIVEGAGGIMVPLNEKEFLSDILIEAGMPVILVVRNRLGAINHTLLTVEKLKNIGVSINGLVFNNTDEHTPEYIRADNLKTISRITGITVISELSFADDPGITYKRCKDDLKDHFFPEVVV